MSDSDSDSDLDEYSNIAASFQSVVDKMRKQKETPPKKRGVPSPEKKLPDSPEKSIPEAVEIHDSDSDGTNLDDTSNLNDSSPPESPVEIVDDSELNANERVSRLRPRRRRAHPFNRSPQKKSPAKKKLESKIIPVDDDEDDSFTLSPVVIKEKEDPNPEITVKVFWRYKDLKKFPVRKFQKITSIFEAFSKLEEVPVSRIQLCLKDKMLKPDDTPDTLNLKITDVLEGGVLSSEVVSTDLELGSKKPQAIPPNSIPLKIMRKDVKEPLVIRLTKTDNMNIFKIKVAEELNLKETEFKLFFDGDVVDPDDTPETLDLEGNECFELKT